MPKTATKRKKAARFAPTQKALDVVRMKSSTDINGSYTGRPLNKGERPVQDADDL
jgi:hypothetical protein